MKKVADMVESGWRATCIQMPSALATKCATPAEAWDVIEGNVACAVGMIEAACAGDLPPRLVVLPEFAFQGPPHGELVENWIAKACDTIPGRITAPLQAQAKARGIYIAGNLFESDPKWPGRFFNSSFLIDDKGEVILRYRRINTAMWPSPHDFMDAYVEAEGDAGVFPVVDTPLGKLAVLACGEIFVPEVTRVFMMRGAEVLLHPTNEEFSPAQEAAKIARAAENMMYVVSANVAGAIGFSPDGKIQGGRSRIIDYRGATLAYRAETDPSDAVTALIDIDALRAARTDTSMANALLRGRWEMYRPHYAAFRAYPPNAFLAAPMKDGAETRPFAEAALGNLAAAGVSRL